jgi:hypothetical protein
VLSKRICPLTDPFFVVAVYSVAHTSQVLVSELAVKAKKGRAKAGAGETSHTLNREHRHLDTHIALLSCRDCTQRFLNFRGLTQHGYRCGEISGVITSCGLSCL